MASLFLSRKKMSKITWGISLFIGLMLLYYVAYLHGVPKLMGDEGLLGFFTDTVGVGAIGLYLSGVAEVFGPVLMLHWKTSFYGAFLLLVNFLVASYVVWGTGVFPTETLIYVALGLLVAWLMRPVFLRKREEITKISV